MSGIYATYKGDCPANTRPGLSDKYATYKGDCPANTRPGLSGKYATWSVRQIRDLHRRLSGKYATWSVRQIRDLQSRGQHNGAVWVVRFRHATFNFWLAKPYPTTGRIIVWRKLPFAAPTARNNYKLLRFSRVFFRNCASFCALKG